VQDREHFRAFIEYTVVDDVGKTTNLRPAHVLHCFRVRFRYREDLFEQFFDRVYKLVAQTCALSSIPVARLD
jgi:hypothetical protein